MVSKILKVSPFSEEMRNMTSWQMDWVVEMWALDNPEAQITRSGECRPENVAVAWSKVMLNDMALIGRMVSSKAVEAAKRLRKEHGHPEGRQ